MSSADDAVPRCDPNSQSETTGPDALAESLSDERQHTFASRAELLREYEAARKELIVGKAKGDPRDCSYEAVKRNLTDLIDMCQRYSARRENWDSYAVGHGIIVTGPNHLDEVKIHVRWNRFPRPFLPTKTYYDTIEVTHISWALLDFFLPMSEMPRGLATPVWAALKEIAQAKSRALFVECVNDTGSGKLNARMASLGFAKMGDEPTGCNWMYVPPEVLPSH